MAQCVKDLVVLLLWRGFSPWPWNVHMLWEQPKKKKKNQCEKRDSINDVSTTGYL